MTRRSSDVSRRRVIRNRVVEESFWAFLIDDLRPRAVSNVEFHHCHFQSWGFSKTTRVDRRASIRNVLFRDCQQTGCSIGPAIIEEVTVDGLRTNGLLQCWGAAYRHVTFLGKLGRLMFSPLISPHPARAIWQPAFDEANDAFYRTVDWAIDIREAKFGECDLRGIPARLVIRDSETQVVVKREKAMNGDWQALPLSNTYWPTALQLFLETGRDDIVLVAPKRSKNFRALREGLELLRREGVAEPD